MSLYGITTAAEALAAYEAVVADAPERITKKPHDAVEIAHEVARALAVSQTFAWWERERTALDEYAEENGWTPEHRLLVKFDTVLKYAVRDVDDTWSGRLNDSRRVAHEGKLDVLELVENELRAEMRKLGAR